MNQRAESMNKLNEIITQSSKVMTRKEIFEYLIKVCLNSKIEYVGYEMIVTPNILKTTPYANLRFTKTELENIKQMFLLKGCPHCKECKTIINRIISYQKDL